MSKTLLQDLDIALDVVNVDVVVRLRDSAPMARELFFKPLLRHRINQTHNRATMHAVALEHLFSKVHPFERSVQMCRMLLEMKAPVVLAHEFQQISPTDRYASALFAQQSWSEDRLWALDPLFDDYVAADYVKVNQNFSRNDHVFGLSTMLEAALCQGNCPAVRALFRHRVDASKVGIETYGKAMGIAEFLRTSNNAGAALISKMNMAVMEGQLQANARDTTSTTQTETATRKTTNRRRMGI